MDLEVFKNDMIWGPSWLLSYGSWNLPMQSIPITTKDVCWNATHGEVHSIQHEIKFVRDMQHVSCLSGTLVSSINKTDSHNIIEILLKMA